VALGSLPQKLQHICTDHPFERLLHSRGRDFVDIARNVQGPPGAPTDLVAFPRTEADIAAVLAHCSAKNIAVVPFGGGSSVVFGVNPPEDAEGFAGTITIDMLYFDKVLEVDEVSMCARVQGGVFGPSLERQLKHYGLTLRHFPQSFEFSTVGGWVATRGAGHFATGPTHIDECVESVRLLSPAGVTETRRLPGSGAGPAEHRLYVGSEGTLGVVTEVWLRLRRAPVLRASATILFKGTSDDEAFMAGARAVQRVSQAGLQPANLRLVYGAEIARMAQEADLQNSAVLFVGFETPDEQQDLDTLMRSALGLCEQCGGHVEGGWPASFVTRGGGQREGIAGKWGTGFMRGGYTFSAAVLAGLILNTFETSVTWDRFFGGFHEEVLAASRKALAEHSDGGVVTCRLTHVYPDGPAPYYTILARTDGDRVQRWLKTKAAAMDAVMALGGTSTHHHAVGKLHRSHYHRELGALFATTLAAVKTVHDPAWVMNPGVLWERRSKL